MSFIDIITINEIIPYIVAVVIAAILIHYITEWFKSQDKKKNRSIWINFLRSNEIIDKCILTFEDIVDAEGKQGTSISRTIAFLLGLLSIFFLTALLLTHLRDLALSMAYASLINFVPYISLLIFSWYLNNLIDGKKEGDLIKESLPIVNFINAINWFIFGSSFFTIGFIFLIFMNLNQIPQMDIKIIQPLFILSVTVLITTFFALNFIARRRFLDFLKDRLNNQYVENFPYIHITTKAGEINGNIQDVFHDHLIILDDNGTKIVAKWDEIITLKLRAKNLKSLDLSCFV